MKIEGLSDLQKRFLIAEFCGWTGCYFNERYVTGIDPYGIERDLPNYPNDLNACHEAENTLNQEQWDDFISALLENDKHPGADRDGNKTDKYDTWRIVASTARDRSNALLLTLPESLNNEEGIR